MAYKFERCPKAVSGAAPVKYAQRLVQMCQEHLVQTQNMRDNEKDAGQRDGYPFCAEMRARLASGGMLYN